MFFKRIYQYHVQLTLPNNKMSVRFGDCNSGILGFLEVDLKASVWQQEPMKAPVFFYTHLFRTRAETCSIPNPDPLSLCQLRVPRHKCPKYEGFNTYHKLCFFVIFGNKPYSHLDIIKFKHTLGNNNNQVLAST